VSTLTLRRVNKRVITVNVMTNESETNIQAPAEQTELKSSPASKVSPTAGVVLTTGNRKGADTSKVDVFTFTNYREFLNAFYENKRAKNPAYSMSSFIRRAGLGANSRGYLKMVISGKRNLTANTIRRFSEAMSLNGKESLYFENLVHFNQAQSAQDKHHFMERLSAAAEGSQSKQFEILKSHYHYYTSWHYAAVRELVGLATFQEDMGWISSQLRNKINRRQAQEALEILLRLEMIKRDESGKLVQSEPLVKYTGGSFSGIHHKFHLEMIERAKESLNGDPYTERNGSGLTLSCDHDRLPEIKKAIDAFRDEINTKFGLGSTNPDTVFQINIQFFQLTPIQKRSKV
jgi:uncharacterized protein (TIGR02147 family)